LEVFFMDEPLAPPRVVEVPIAALKPAPWNPRSISDERFQNLCRSMQEDAAFLWRRPILAQKDGTVYAGNMRLRAALHLGMTHVPAIIEDVPDRLAKERALRDNAQWGEWEDDGLAAMLRDLDNAESEVEYLGFTERELQQLLDRPGSAAGLGDPDEIPELAKVPETQPGDVWQLGPHRVICGDSTDGADVAKLMEGELASCLWTDAPYGVDYTGGTKERLKMANDDSATVASLLAGAYKTVDAVLEPGAAIYTMHPAGPLAMTFWEAFRNQGWTVRQGLVWAKDSLVLGRSDYHYQHEPILFGYKPATGGRQGRGGKRWYGDNARSSVFAIPSNRQNAEHPTAKPVALVEAMIANSTKSGEIVLDPFLGSGTTLIAAERLGRRSFGLELEPRYAEVAVRRWEQLTGKVAVRQGAER
jgi:DNA modification methylase